jgi:hypothetical protein
MNSTLVENGKAGVNGLTKYTWWKDGTIYVSALEACNMNASIPTYQPSANISRFIQRLES